MDSSCQAARECQRGIDIMSMVELFIDQPKNDQGNSRASKQFHIETSAAVAKVPAKSKLSQQAEALYLGSGVKHLPRADPSSQAQTATTSTTLDRRATPAVCPALAELRQLGGRKTPQPTK